MMKLHSRNERERRNDSRLLCAELVELIYRDSTGHPRRRVVNLDDISKCGACLQTEMALGDGEPVSIRYNTTDLHGKVRHCAEREGSYFIGIEFEGNSRWEQDEFLPDHLIDPAELVRNAMERAGSYM